MCRGRQTGALKNHRNGAYKAPGDTMRRFKSNNRGSRKRFSKRAKKTHRLNTAQPLRGGIRL